MLRKRQVEGKDLRQQSIYPLTSTGCEYHFFIYFCAEICTNINSSTVAAPCNQSRKVIAFQNVLMITIRDFSSLSIPLCLFVTFVVPRPMRAKYWPFVVNPAFPLTWKLISHFLLSLSNRVYVHVFCIASKNFLDVWAIFYERPQVICKINK